MAFFFDLLISRFAKFLGFALFISLSLNAPLLAEGEWGFELISDETELIGCWQRVMYPADVMKRMNKIQIYDEGIEFFDYQYFCFQEDNELYTLISNSPDRSDLSAAELLKFMKIFPCVERYQLVDRGILLIEHLDANQQATWLTSAVVGSGEAGAKSNIQIGDLLMTIRNFETGEDLYYRQLRRVE